MLSEYQIEYRNGKPAAYEAKSKYLAVNARNRIAAEIGAQKMLDDEGWCVTVTNVTKTGQAWSNRVPTVTI